MDNAELVCWNCLKRTPPGTCRHCEVELSNPDEAFQDKREPVHKRIIRIPINQKDEKESETIEDEDQVKADPNEDDLTIRDLDNQDQEMQNKNEEDGENAQEDFEQYMEIDLEVIDEMVEDVFTIERVIYGSYPAYIVNHPGDQLDEKFNELLKKSQQIHPGFKPRLEKHGDSGNLLLVFVYNEPRLPANFQTVFLLLIFTIISVFLAGIFNSSQLQTAIVGGTVDVTNVFSVILNLDVFVYSLLFGGALLLLVGIKDFIQLKSLFSSEENYLTLFYVPAPPIFELGMLGSIHHQDRFHKTREHMFSSTFFGPVIAWILSVILIFASLPLARYNPSAAALYSNHSITANGEMEPIILSILVRLSNLLGLSSFDLSAPFTSLYVLHPLTAGALGAFYIVTFALFPVAHLNGGYIVRSVYGKRAHMIFTYLTVAAVYFVNWVIAVFLFFIHELLKTPDVLNEESKLQPNRKQLMIPFFIILLISYPFKLSILNWIF